MTGPLSGIRVADFTQLYQGPLATQVLADMGADIVKIEPQSGDFFRRWSLGNRFPEGESLSFLTVNRNKRSIVLDLKHPAGVEAARAIVAQSDLVVENFRPGVMERLGLGYDALSAAYPRIVYCASSGYGRSGPYRDYPGQDLLVQAIGGTMWLNGRQDDPPTAIGFGIADVAGGLHIVIGALAALHERGRTGIGQRVDVNLLNSLLLLQTHELGYFANTGDRPVRPRANTTATYAGAPLGVYETSDGYVALSMMSVGQLARLIGADELSDIESDNEIEHRDEIHAVLESHFKTRTRTAWLEILRSADVWCAPVQTLDETLVDPQVVWNNVVREIDHPIVGRLQMIGPSIEFGRTPAEVRLPPPMLGQHSTEILLEAGYDSRAIDELLKNGAVRENQQVPRSTAATSAVTDDGARSPTT